MSANQRVGCKDQRQQVSGPLSVRACKKKGDEGSSLDISRSPVGAAHRDLGIVVGHRRPGSAGRSRPCDAAASARSICRPWPPDSWRRLFRSGAKDRYADDQKLKGGAAAAWRRGLDRRTSGWRRSARGRDARLKEFRTSAPRRWYPGLQGKGTGRRDYAPSQEKARACHKTSS